MGATEDLWNVAEGAMDQIGNAYQAFLYGFPPHTSMYGTHSPDWFTNTTAEHNAVSLGGHHHQAEFSPDINPEQDNTLDRG